MVNKIIHFKTMVNKIFIKIHQFLHIQELQNKTIVQIIFIHLIKQIIILDNKLQIKNNQFFIILHKSINLIQTYKTIKKKNKITYKIQIKIIFLSIIKLIIILQL